MQRLVDGSMTGGVMPVTSGNTLSDRRNGAASPSRRRAHVHHSPMQRLPRLVELLLIVALCGVIALWVTRVMRGGSIAVPAQADVGAASGPSRVDAVLASARLFGSRPPGVLSDNVRALGVIADATGRGSVIVSVDGQPPKVYRVGDTLDGRLVTAIRPEEIELESGGARQTFRLPPRSAASGVTVLGSGPVPVIGPNQTMVVAPPTSPQMPQPSPMQSMSEPPPIGQNGLPAQPDPRRGSQMRGNDR
jgi:general secretion pathway protein C